MFFTLCAAYSYENIYMNRSNYKHTGNFNRSQGYNRSYSPIYDPYSTTYFNSNVPYSNYYSPYGYNRNFKNMRILRSIQRLKRSYTPTRYLSFSFRKGAPTGFSPPISSDILQNLGFNPHDKNQKLNSPTCDTEIFATPNTNNFYRNKNGNKGQDGGGAVGKTGVTIIYD